MMTLISADNSMAVMAALFVIAGLGFISEKTRIGANLTGTVITIILAIVAANVHIIPHNAPAYGFVFTYMVPILIPLFLFKADLKKIFFETTRTTAAFLLASVGTVAGVTLAALSLDLSAIAAQAPLSGVEKEAAVAGLFASTYIGGSVNYAALGEITGLSKDASFFSAATAADNLFSAVYLAFLALLPGWHWLAKKYVQHDDKEIVDSTEKKADISAMSLVLALASAMIIVAVGDYIVNLLDDSSWRYIVITILSLLVATFARGFVAQLSGSFELGVGFSFIFFAAIAAGANVVAMIQLAPILIVLVFMLLNVHFLLTFVLGKFLKLSLPELIIASNAAILGATTAPALAAAKGWNNLITPGILVGVFGYALGTFVGTMIFKFWHLVL